MTIEFPAAELAHVRHLANPHVLKGADYPEALQSIVSVAFSAPARAEIRQWPAHAETPLRHLNTLARTIGVDSICYKDESTRFGLGSFKALGGAYEVLYALTREISRQLGHSVTMADVRSGKHRDIAATITMVSATDGNHGRSVAWGAQNFGCACRIYVHAEVSKGRCDAVEAYGATLVRVDGDYDDSVHACAREAADNGWHIVSDTSYPGYMELPKQAMAGYSLMVDEVLTATANSEPFSHVFVQAGCGGLAAAVLGFLWDSYGASRPRFVVVEPTLARCLFNAAQNGPESALPIEQESIMAGLSCGEISQLAWQVLGPCVDDFVLIPDATIAPVMRYLASPGTSESPIVAGESAVAGLSALIAARQRSDLASTLALDSTSRILLFGTEGATDLHIYETLTGHPPPAV